MSDQVTVTKSLAVPNVKKAPVPYSTGRVLIESFSACPETDSARTRNRKKRKWSLIILF